MNTPKQLTFKVSARTAALIGRENVSNAEAAVIELVKNSYDADASEAKIVFDEDDLIIADSGVGMTEEVIRSSWMVIGTDNKKTSPLSPGGRVKSGAKGIGRFALDRLGSNVTMITLVDGASTGTEWSVDWGSFQEENTTVDSIQATMTSLPSSICVQELANLGFKNATQGTVLRISGLSDEWTERNLDRLFQALESLIPPGDDADFDLEMKSTRHPKKFGRVESLITKDFDYELKASYDHIRKEVSVNISRNEFDLKLLERKFKGVFKEKGMGSFPYDEETFKKGHYKTNVAVNEVLNGHVDESLLESIGDFSFHIVFAKNTKPNNEDISKYPYRTLDYRTRSEWLKKFGGIRIYRDNFRVRPYGENGDDWLRLGERQAQSPQGAGQRLGGYRVRPNQVTGGVYISRLSNKFLEDKSSREGIVENDTFELLQNLIKGIIGLLEDDRNMIFYSLSNLYKKTNQSGLVKEKAKKVVADIKLSEHDGSHNWRSNKEDAETLVDLVDILESESKDKDEEIRVLRSLASAGLITAAAAHELKGFRNHLKTRNGQLRTLLARYIKEDGLSDVRPAFNPFVQIDHMKNADESISGWLEYALMPLQRDKRTRSKVNINDYFSGLERTWHDLLSTRRIKLAIQPCADSITVRMFPIDLDTVFNNLIINSVESFSRQNTSSNRKISIDVNKSEFGAMIEYRDNGSGLDESFAKNPDKIFLPQVTTKLDMAGNPIGTGMGMYLVKSVVDENGGTIELDIQLPGFGADIEFKAAL